ncbi:MAG: class I SAM-dependent methyltransferase [Magnetococcales bacterium]|nr:class I SAM-dependent methyltransferase [Magnetococcales bacterium]MBF0156885.1 class I SAM-dependent methyltransferase [Magnetococcales bacterium]
MDYLRDDLRRTVVRLAANERWYEQRWLGTTIWQLPEDLLRLQEILCEVRPRWVIETGTKFGGSAIFFASLLALLGEEGGGVISIDCHHTDQAREVFARHPLAHRVRAVLEGDAADPAIAARAGECLGTDPGRVLVFLDDDHNRDHVAAELRLYAPLVSLGSYLIVADTVFAELAGTPVVTDNPRYPDPLHSNPRVAVEAFLAARDDFARDDRFHYRGIGNFPDGFLRRIAPEPARSQPTGRNKRLSSAKKPGTSLLSLPTAVTGPSFR